MSAHNEFQFLDDDARQLLENDLASKDGYRDLLGYLHDLLIPFASKPEHARYSEGTAWKALDYLLPLFPSSHQIGKAARGNFAAAQFLRTRLETGEHDKLAAVNQTAVDEFVNDLLLEYGNIRNIGSREHAPSRR